MKNLLLKTIIASALIGAAQAETDTFDMSLTGDIVKDYCVFEMGENQEFDVNVGMIESNEPVIVKRQVIYLNCSAGTYDIRIATTESAGDIDIGGGISASFYATVWSRFLLGSAGYQTWPDKISRLTPYSTEGVEFRYNNSSIQFLVEETIIPIDGDWNGVADTFSNSVPFVVTIDNVGQ